MKTSGIFIKSLEIRDSLKSQNDFKENPIENTLLPVLPFRVSNKIKLIIIGQDPTVKNELSRKTIEYTLNLDINGSLKNYIKQICAGLGIEFENIYATNVFKYFYTYPPERTMHVLHSHLEPNLQLLRDEISAYPKAKIITLGLPVLQLMAGEQAQVSQYWGYDKKTGKSLYGFSACLPDANKLGRKFYPFPHQPKIVKGFYKNHLSKYINFVKFN